MAEPEKWQPDKSGWQRRDAPDLRELEPTPVWAKELVRWMDTAVRIPGTNITFGLDAILGMLLPSAGDALTAVGTLSLFTLAVRYHVPKVILLRMLLNVAIDTVVGLVPVLGDVFDVFFRSNRRNLGLIERYRQAPGKPATTGDYVFAGATLLAMLALLAVPIVVAALVVGAVWRYASGG